MRALCGSRFRGNVVNSTLLYEVILKAQKEHLLRLSSLHSHAILQDHNIYTTTVNSATRYRVEDVHVTFNNTHVQLLATIELNIN